MFYTVMHVECEPSSAVCASCEESEGFLEISGSVELGTFYVGPSMYSRYSSNSSSVSALTFL